jgi:hypothetical protein
VNQLELEAERQRIIAAIRQRPDYEAYRFTQAHHIRAHRKLVDASALASTASLRFHEAQRKLTAETQALLAEFDACMRQEVEGLKRTLSNPHEN